MASIQDTILTSLVEKYGTNSWNRISKSIADKSEIKCHTRWLELNNLENFSRGTWSKQEDQKLIEKVQELGPRNWSLIAKSLPGRIGKQCRERWHNHLDPNINKSKWTKDEDTLIVDLYRKLGKKWCEIAKYIPGRTDNAIKNRFNSNLKRQLDKFPVKDSNKIKEPPTAVSKKREIKQIATKNVIKPTVILNKANSTINEQPKRLSLDINH